MCVREKYFIKTDNKSLFLEPFQILFYFFTFTKQVCLYNTHYEQPLHFDTFFYQKKR